MCQKCYPLESFLSSYSIIRSWLKAQVKRRTSHEPNRMQMIKNPLFSLISIRFGSCEGRRLTSVKPCPNRKTFGDRTIRCYIMFDQVFVVVKTQSNTSNKLWKRENVWSPRRGLIVFAWSPNISCLNRAYQQNGISCVQKTNRGHFMCSLGLLQKTLLYIFVLQNRLIFDTQLLFNTFTRRDL